MSQIVGQNPLLLTREDSISSFTADSPAIASSMHRSQQKLNIVHYCTEMTPMIWGGLGLATNGIAFTQKAQGHNVAVILPYIGNVQINGPAPEIISNSVSIKLPTAEILSCWVLRSYAKENNMPIYFVHHPLLNGRNIYAYAKSSDQLHVLISLAALEITKKFIFPAPHQTINIFHCHDWPTAIACYFLRKDPFFQWTASIFTIHNFAHQGIISIDDALGCGLDSELFHALVLLHGSYFSLLRIGLIYADRLITVSPSYRNETLMGNQAEGNEDILTMRASNHQYDGILNGVDATWDPSVDEYLHQKYTANTVTMGKAANKTFFQETYGLKVDARVCLMVACSRITEQKGFQYLVANIDKLLAGGAVAAATDALGGEEQQGKKQKQRLQIVIIGNVAEDDRFGEELAEQFRSIQLRYPTSFKFLPFQRSLESLADAAADLFYMCSTFEPCGLSNQVAGRYGAVVVGTAVGGIQDSVYDYRLDPHRGNGFLANKTDASHVYQAIIAALSYYYDDEAEGQQQPQQQLQQPRQQQHWSTIVQNAMSRDTSWQGAVLKYGSIYQLALKERREKVIAAAVATSGVNKSVVERINELLLDDANPAPQPLLQSSTAAAAPIAAVKGGLRGESKIGEEEEDEEAALTTAKAIVHIVQTNNNNKNNNHTNNYSYQQERPYHDEDLHPSSGYTSRTTEALDDYDYDLNSDDDDEGIEGELDDDAHGVDLEEQSLIKHRTSNKQGKNKKQAASTAGRGGRGGGGKEKNSSSISSLSKKGGGGNGHGIEGSEDGDDDAANLHLTDVVINEKDVLISCCCGFFALNLTVLSNLRSIFMKCYTQPNNSDFMYIIFKTSLINLGVRAYFITTAIGEGELTVRGGVMSLVWYQGQDAVFTLWGQTYMKFLGRMTPLLTIGGAQFGDLFWVFFQLFILEFSNRAILGSMGSTASVFTWLGIGEVIFNILQGLASGGPVDPAINKLRESGLISHRTAMHIFQISGLSMLFGLTATFGYQELHAILLGSQFTLSMSVYLIFTLFRNPARIMRLILRFFYNIICCSWLWSKGRRASDDKNGAGPEPITTMPKSMKDISLVVLNPKKYHPSPEHWANEVIYSLLVDRFAVSKEHLSDGYLLEKGTIRWQGGDLRGIQKNLTYLLDLGITTILLSPVQQQARSPSTSASSSSNSSQSKESLKKDEAASGPGLAAHDPYHGYAPINLLQIDEHFGSISDLQVLVQTCHHRGLRIILDFSINHLGPVFEYGVGQGEWSGMSSGPKPIAEWTQEVYPTELKNPSHFSRYGSIVNWDDDAQSSNGDFPPNLRRLNTGNVATQSILLDILCYYVKILDIDGYRLDAVKHVHPSFLHRLSIELKTYAEYQCNKKNFLLLGEISSGKDSDLLSFLQLQPACAVYNYPDYRRVNLALHGQASIRMIELSWRKNLQAYGGSSNGGGNGSNNSSNMMLKLVRFLDNHDTYRFLRQGEELSILLAGLAYLLLSPGIPMIYAGSEQHMRQSSRSLAPEGPHDPADPENRQPLFKRPRFNPMSSDPPEKLYDTTKEAYLFIKELSDVRKAHPVLCLGEVILRYSSPVGPGLFAFSRIYRTVEALIVINFSKEARAARIFVDARLHHANHRFMDLLDNNYQIRCQDATVEACGVMLHVMIPPRGQKGVRILVRREYLDETIRNESGILPL